MRSAWVALLLACLAILGTLLFWPAHPHRQASKTSACMSNLKRASLGMMMYANDNDDRFALRDEWCDAIYPYTKQADILQCPVMATGTYGYAFNGALSSATFEKVPQPGAVPMIYESVNPIRNASDLVTSLPKPGRHITKGATTGKDIIAYVDGHVKGVVR